MILFELYIILSASSQICVVVYCTFVEIKSSHILTFEPTNNITTRKFALSHSHSNYSHNYIQARFACLRSAACGHCVRSVALRVPGIFKKRSIAFSNSLLKKRSCIYG